MSTRRSPTDAAVSYAAEPLPGGGWRVTVPGAPPSQNTLDREHWAARSRRVADMTAALTTLRRARGLAAPVFERCRVGVTIHYAVRRRRDLPNALGGLKQHVDALVVAGWAADDDTEHMSFDLPILSVSRPPRVVFDLMPFDRSDAS